MIKIDMRATVFVTFLAIVGLILTLVIRLGGFKPVAITEATAGPWKIVYKHNLGAYYKIAPVIDEVERYVKAHGPKCALTFGQFLDDVDRVSEDRLNSNGGCIVDTPMTALPQDYLQGELPQGSFVVAEFNGAPSIGPMKVYPRVKNYMAAHHLISSGPTIEIYEIMGDQSVLTRYYFPSKRQP